MKSKLEDFFERPNYKLNKQLNTKDERNLLEERMREAKEKFEKKIKERDASKVFKGKKFLGGKRIVS